MVLEQSVQHKGDVLDRVCSHTSSGERASAKRKKNRDGEPAKREKEEEKKKKKRRKRAQRATVVTDAGAEVDALRTRYGTEMSRENRRDTHNVKKDPIGRIPYEEYRRVLLVSVHVVDGEYSVVDDAPAPSKNLLWALSV